MTTKSTHGGRRLGAGRPRRTDEKAVPIWVGQIPDDERQFILDTLTPNERFQALMVAALAKQKQDP